MAATKAMVEAMKESEKPAMDKREEVTEAVLKERKERLERCKTKIEAVLKQEKCILTATPIYEEASPGVFVTKANPGIRAL